ncbi:Glutathione transport system permease protein GsiD [subsurface metagenome]
MADSSSGRVAETRRHPLLVELGIRLVKEKPLGTVGAVITLLLLFTGIFADFLAPYGMNENVGALLAPPSAKFWLGTDNIGRDLLSRVIFGARISVIVGLATPTLGTLISVMIGLISGYIGGKFDLVAQRFVDAWMCFPGLMVVMVIISIIKPGVLQVIIVLSLLFGINGSRIIRGAVIGIKGNLYVEAARAIGCSTTRILTRHILPNIMGPTLMMFSGRVSEAILAEAALSFLGFGIPPPFPSWGGMLSGNSRTYMFQAPWLAIWPGLALAAVVYGTNMFGDAVRDILDPRLRGGVGRYGVRVRSKNEPSTQAIK